jgi:hypothetical protein
VPATTHLPARTSDEIEIAGVRREFGEGAHGGKCETVTGRNAVLPCASHRVAARHSETLWLQKPGGVDIPPPQHKYTPTVTV